MVKPTMILAAIKDLNNRLSAMEHTVNDVLIKSLMDANDEYQYNDSLESFRDKYSEALDPLLQKMKALYGEDYDVYKDLYDTMATHREEDGFDEDQYIASQIEQVNEKLDALAHLVVNSDTPRQTDEVQTPPEVVQDSGEDEVAVLPDEEQLAQELRENK